MPPTSDVSSDMAPAHENDSVRPPAVPRPFCSCSMRRFCSGAEEEQEEDEEQEEEEDRRRRRRSRGGGGGGGG